MKNVLIFLIILFLVSCGRQSGKVRGLFEINTTFTDKSVNNASISWSQNDESLHLMSAGGANAAGSFQGGGIGNKAIAANKYFHNTFLTDFGVTWEKNNSASVYLNLLIDTTGDKVADHVLVYDEYVGQVLSFDNTKSFKIVCMPDCVNWHNTYYNINDFPGAKIVNSTIQDGGMPADALTKAMPGVLVILGDSSTTVVLESTLSNFSLQ
ncbi:MAG: hypothetical protein JNM93_04300 [Bacteriovoracaceae bacterium]|nr:hypothetical protein [Bacteriovoracaceae bacterium]